MSPCISWREHRPPDIELGDNHALWFVQWAPARDLNPQYDGVPDVQRYSAVIEHPSLIDGSLCLSAIHFDTPEVRLVDEASRKHCEKLGIPYHDYPRWQVESWDPLTVSPSLLCTPGKLGCGDHGFIRQSKWVRA